MSPVNLGQWYQDGLAAAPGGTALRIHGRRWTYAELHATALRLAGAMTAAADGRPAVVGILASRSIECYAGILAAGYAGAAAVPLSPVFPVERTARMVRAAGVRVIAADAAGAAALSGLASSVPGLTVVRTGPEVRVPQDVRAVTATPAGALAAPMLASPQDPAYILFTSGSTGSPKGVPVTHANMAHFLNAARARYGLRPGDVVSQTFDCTFDLAMFDLFVTWAAGAELVSTPPQAFLDLPEFAARNGLTVWFSVPSAIELVRRRGGLSSGSLPGLRWSLFCGEPLTLAHARQWQEAAPGSAVENLYGPTELTIACTAHRWDPSRSPAMSVNGLVPIGDLTVGLSGLLIGPDGEQAQQEGELCVRGPQMFPGYLDSNDDRGRFITARGSRWYLTGDVVRLVSESEYSYLGRSDQQVKIRGYRVELAELEWRCRGIPGLSQAVVVLVRDSSGPRLFAWCTGEPEAADRIRPALAAEVPEFMVPRWARHLDELPLTASGKTDRLRLANMAQQLVQESAGDRGRPAVTGSPSRRNGAGLHA
jgi:amino acid adenylation domain-containing protein